MAKDLRLLFVGNSHTYYNDLPAIVRGLAEKDGFDCSVTMVAHGGWFLDQHVKEPDVKFNILYGKYDYVVIQEHANPMDEERFLVAAKQLCLWIRDAGSMPVVYGAWPKKDTPEKREFLNACNRKVAAENNTLLAAVGEVWPESELYNTDGLHASKAGSEFAAGIIWKTIVSDLEKK